MSSHGLIVVPLDASASFLRRALPPGRRKRRLEQLTVTASSRTSVLPPRPHAPAAGLNTSGASVMKSSCCSGISDAMPQASSGEPKVANIFPPARKSAWVM
jgi:hypothetical protein